MEVKKGKEINKKKNGWKSEWINVLIYAIEVKA